jgi:plasmid stabilization system protein ParE
MRSLIVEPEAEQELAEARDWYERQKPGLGGALLAQVGETLERLLRQELASVAVPHVRTELPVRRALPDRFPYSIVFVDHDDRLFVVAFAHHRRRSAYWAHRLQR